MEIKPSEGGIIKFWIDRIVGEYFRIIKNDPRIKEFIDKNDTEETPVNISVKRYSTSQMLYMDMLADHPGRLSHKFVEDKLEQMHYDETEVAFTMRTSYDVRDDRVWVSGGRLIIRTTALVYDLCMYVHDLDYLWNLHKLMLKHEVGHFIDHMLNQHGITVAEFDKHQEINAEDKRRHYEWLREYRKEPGFDAHTCNRAYYAIPSEARANEYGGITSDDLINIVKDKDKRWKNKVITLDINVTGIKDLEKESDQNGDIENIS